MGLFSSRKVKEPAYIVCTVEAHSVSCAIYLRKEKPEIIFAVRDNLIYKRHPSAKRIFDKVNNLFKNLLLNSVLPFIKENGELYEFVHATIVHSLLWSHEESKYISHMGEKEFILTEEYVNNIIDTEHNKVGKEDNFKVVASRISNMHINGYVTPNMFGKSAKFFSCRLQRTLVDKTFLEKIEESLHSVVKTDVIHATEFDLFDVFIPFVGAESKMFAISFGSETVEIAIYNHIERKDSVSVPVGIETLVRGIALKVHENESVAFSHILSLSRGERVPTKTELDTINNSMKSLRLKVNKALFDIGESIEGINSIICIYPESYRDISIYFLKNFLCNNSISVIDPYTAKGYRDSIKIRQPINYIDPLVEISVLSANKK